jgi:hypothetical protein
VRRLSLLFVSFGGSWIESGESNYKNKKNKAFTNTIKANIFMGEK